MHFVHLKLIKQWLLTPCLVWFKWWGIYARRCNIWRGHKVTIHPEHWILLPINYQFLSPALSIVDMTLVLGSQVYTRDRSFRKCYRWTLFPSHLVSGQSEFGPVFLTVYMFHLDSVPAGTSPRTNNEKHATKFSISDGKNVRRWGEVSTKEGLNPTHFSFFFPVFDFSTFVASQNSAFLLLCFVMYIQPSHWILY